MNRANRSRKTTNRKTPKPGQYIAVVTDVKSPEGYQPGNAIDVFYSLADPETGKTFPFKERFLIADQFDERVQGFEEHLDEVGAERYEDYVGYKLEVLLQFQVKHHRTFCNIVERRLISASSTVSEADTDE